MAFVSAREAPGAATATYARGMHVSTRTSPPCTFEGTTGPDCPALRAKLWAYATKRS